MKLLKYGIIGIGTLMLVLSAMSVSAETIGGSTSQLKTPGFEIVIFLVAIGIVALALILYRGYKKRKKTLGYEYPAHEKGKLK